MAGGFEPLIAHSPDPSPCRSPTVPIRPAGHLPVAGFGETLWGQDGLDHRAGTTLTLMHYPCLSRTHAPASCVPCVDFSPWLAERVRRRDVEAVAEYLYRIREPNPGIGESPEQLRANYTQLAERIVNAPFDRFLTGGDEAAFTDLRVALVLLAVHEGFSGFIMTGEAADFMASVMAPHRLAICDVQHLVEDRNEFVRNDSGKRHPVQVVRIR